MFNMGVLSSADTLANTDSQLGYQLNNDRDLALPQQSGSPK